MDAKSLSPSRRTLLALGLVCFANLMLEVALTRIFSATMFYHFTFLAIALALFGVGASGVYVYVRSDRFTPERAQDDLASNARRFAITTVMGLVYVLANPLDLGIGSSKSFVFTAQTMWQLVFLNLFAATPFFFAGVVVSLAITHFRAEIGRVYFYDLCGAALAALVAGLLIGLLGGPSLVLALGLIAAIASVLFQSSSRATWVAAAAILALLACNQIWPIVSVHSVKGVRAERTVFEKWNTYSRITVERLGNDQLDIKIDASAATRLTDAAAIATRAWRKEVSAYAFSLFPQGASSVLIIGPGGGPDVVNALAAGAKQVIGVEINPIIANDIMRERFVAESGGLYQDPRVRIVVDEGRSFIRRSAERYQVIQATLVDTWAATASGAFALTENTLYTVEAFAEYYAHLTEDGVVTMSRWHGGPFPETARLLVVAAAGLVKHGIPAEDTRRHILFVRKGALGTLVVKRTPFDDAELRLAEQAARSSGFEIVVSPAGQAQGSKDDLYNKLVAAGPYSSFVAEQRQDLSPPTDDRPFFFYFTKPQDMWNSLGGKAHLSDSAMWILLAFSTSIVALAILFILLPLVFHRRGVLRARGHELRKRVVSLGYFGLIGLGFIIVEIGMMQKLGLFLGHPSYGLLVVLFSLLLATALGARLSERIREVRHGAFALAAGLAIAVLSIGYAGALSAPLQDWVAWPLPLRVLVSFVVTSIPGVLMGLMLPMGVKLSAACDHELVPWGWGINGATSVIGTVAATIVAIHYGFDITLIVGAVAYICAGISAYVLGKMLARGVGSR